MASRKLMFRLDSEVVTTIKSNRRIDWSRVIEEAVRAKVGTEGACPAMTVEEREAVYVYALRQEIEKLKLRETEHGRVV
jgi:hypothetical protein